LLSNQSLSPKNPELCAWIVVKAFITKVFEQSDGKLEESEETQFMDFSWRELHKLIAGTPRRESAQQFSRQVVHIYFDASKLERKPFPWIF
jgi:hypothetical protein